MTFATATGVTSDGPDAWAGDIPPGWDIFGNANGGYLMAVAARALSAAAAGRVPVSVTAHFLRPGRPGPVTVSTQVIREGRTFSTVSGTLAAPEGALLEMLGTFSDPDRPAPEPALVDAEPPDLPPPDDCFRALPAVGAPLPPPLMDKVDVRIHPDDAVLLSGRTTGRALVRGWFRLLEGEPMEPTAIILAADAFPPAVFNASLPLAWTPTLEMTTHVREPRVDGWLRCRFQTRFVSGGYLEEDGELWDESGGLVAQSRQLALLPRDA